MAGVGDTNGKSKKKNRRAGLACTSRLVEMQEFGEGDDDDCVVQEKYAEAAKTRR